MKEEIKVKLRKTKREGMEKLMDWLENKSDFFEAPASSKHHMCKIGGLAEHSWNVFMLFKEKNTRYNLKLKQDSVIICGLLHDICKTNFYKEEQVEEGTSCFKVYKINDKFPIGHGEKSVIILQKFIQLSEEECCIIRWHMSAFGTDMNNPYEGKAYYSAIKKYPTCLALHTADYEATTFLENMI